MSEAEKLAKEVNAMQAGIKSMAEETRKTRKQMELMAKEHAANQRMLKEIAESSRAMNDLVKYLKEKDGVAKPFRSRMIKRPG